MNSNDNIADILKYVVAPVITFILGFLTSRLTMSKKERKDYKISLVEKSDKLSEERIKKYEEFTTAISNYIQKKGKPKFGDFYAISTKGEIYFALIKSICDNIISKTIDKGAIENTHLPIIKETVEKTLPEFYKTLQVIAHKNKYDYAGVLKVENYLSIYTVYRKYPSNRIINNNAAEKEVKS